MRVVFLTTLPTHQGDVVMDWELELTSNPHQLAWNISSRNGSLAGGGTFQVELELGSSALLASGKELVTDFTLHSSSPEPTPHPQKKSIPFVVRTVISATPSALHSLVVVNDASSLTAGETLAFNITLKDAEGMPIEDMADVLIDAELAHNSSGAASICSASYQRDHRFLGRCDLPRSADGAGVPLAGLFSLPVKLGATNKLVGNGSTAQVRVRRCPENWYFDDASGHVTHGECLSCDSLPKGSTRCDSIDGGGVSLSSLQVKENHWRTGTESADVRPCVAHEPVLCTGTQTQSNGDALCRDGHTGAYCSLCVDNYFLGNRGVCATCGSGGALIVTFGLVSISLVVVVVTFLYFLITGRLMCGQIYDRVRGRANDGGRRGSEAAMTATSETRTHVLQLTSIVKMVINFGQIVSRLGPTCVPSSRELHVSVCFYLFLCPPVSLRYSIAWPAAFAELVRWIGGVLSLDVVSLLPMACITSFNFLARVRFVIFGVFLTNLVLGVAWGAAHARRGVGRIVLGIKERVSYVWVGFNYLTYISVCTTIFQMIAQCEEFDDNSKLMKADYSVGCSTPRYKAHLALAWIGVPAFVFAVPLVFFGLLRSAHEDGSLRVAFLSESYRPERYFIEPLNCLQKVTVAGLLVFIEPSFAQMLYAIIIAFFWCVIFALLEPFPSTGENLAHAAINCCTVLLLIGGLSLKLDISQEAGFARALTDGMLWACTLLPVVALTGAIIAEIFFGDAVSASAKTNIASIAQSMSDRLRSFSGDRAAPTMSNAPDASTADIVMTAMAEIEGKLAEGSISEC